MYCCEAVTLRVHYKIARENKREVLLITSDGLMSTTQRGYFTKELTELKPYAALLPQKFDAGEEIAGDMRIALSPDGVQ